MPKKDSAKKAKITKDMTLGEIVTKYPEAAEVMMKRGLHCIGCRMAARESVEQGAAAHGMNKKKIESLLREMNNAVSNE